MNQTTDPRTTALPTELLLPHIHANTPKHNRTYLAFLSWKVVCEECSTAQTGSSMESGTSRA